MRRWTLTLICFFIKWFKYTLNKVTSGLYNCYLARSICFKFYRNDAKYFTGDYFYYSLILCGIDTLNENVLGHVITIYVLMSLITLKILMTHARTMCLLDHAMQKHLMVSNCSNYPDLNGWCPYKFFKPVWLFPQQSSILLCVWTYQVIERPGHHQTHL